MNRRRFLVGALTAVSGLAAMSCRDNGDRPPLDLPSDRPTLLYFYTPN